MFRRDFPPQHWQHRSALCPSEFRGTVFISTRARPPCASSQWVLSVIRCCVCRHSGDNLSKYDTSMLCCFFVDMTFRCDKHILANFYSNDTRKWQNVAKIYYYVLQGCLSLFLNKHVMYNAIRYVYLNNE